MVRPPYETLLHPFVGRGDLTPPHGERIRYSGVKFSGSGVGALRKHAGGMFLASDLGGYAAVASILVFTAKLELLYSFDVYEP